MSKRLIAVCSGAVLLVCACNDAVAQSDEGALQATVTLHLDQAKTRIAPEIYGQFAEHLGHCIYGGIWVGEDSPIPNTRGIRNDVVAALKNIHVPVVRWPGGCFADEYHWKDGIGPRDQRPKMINTHWGGVVESNAFGTHEFMDFCEQVGCQPYICGNVGSGSVEEMMQWVEYMTSDADSPMANLRRKNGRDKPWKLKYFAVGNESWGCGGNMTPEYYSDEFRRYNTFIKNYDPANKIYRVAGGPNSGDYNWTEVLMKNAAKFMQGISLHYYTVPSGSWDHKGSATDFDEAAYHLTLVGAFKMEELLSKHSAIMDRYDPRKRIGLVVDEWGNWYDVEPGSNPGFLYQQNTLRDALTAAVNLDLFQAHADRISMANIAQMVNVLQAMILTDNEKMVLTPTYHVFDMYQVHQGATLIPVEVKTADYELNEKKVPAVHATASKDTDGKIHISLVNLDANHGTTVTIKVPDGSSVNSGTVLTSAKLSDHNTFDQPDVVKPTGFSATKVEGENLTVEMPAKAIVVLELR
ncbi:MAG TPA: alpha-N-arabinofuranosidase [Pirellulales bacterium]|nr:alpha-N-arabinofuranosidase [Pirellulales bacterium]